MEVVYDLANFGRTKIGRKNDEEGWNDGGKTTGI